MNISTNDHNIFGEIIGLRGMPDGESNFDIHLENDTRDSGKTFFQSVSQNALGRYTKSV